MEYELQALCQIAKQYPSLNKMVLFGSRARKEHTRLSDFDIALYFHGIPQRKILLDIDEIHTLLKIDVTIMQADLSQQFLENIKKDGIVLYMNKFEYKLENLMKATNKLEAVTLREIEDDAFMAEVLRDSMIQRFEICYELVWKTMKDYLIYLGFEAESTPRGVFQIAYQNGLIEDSEIWLSMI